ncbi:MAG: hypothetical protein CM15mP115_08150 [Alphaproteobacteria bacterium]|nr:MAG: hypothetical protein CM15mP115_08150 [Alphaproteobacteria bacterium]
MRCCAQRRRVAGRGRISGAADRMARGRHPALGRRLADDPRCRFIEADFFVLARGDDGFDPQAPGRRFDGIFLDIDHSPDFHLNPSHADFYSEEGLARLAKSLTGDGIFALWSNDPPDQAFVARLATQFPSARAEEVVFHNPFSKRIACRPSISESRADAPTAPGHRNGWRSGRRWRRFRNRRALPSAPVPRRTSPHIRRQGGRQASRTPT